MKFLTTLLIVLLSASTASADVIWDYTSTDGTDTVTGQLVTDGDLADVGTPGNSFNLLEITNTFLNGVEITNWSGLGSTPPFTNAPPGLITTTEGGAAEIDILNNSIGAAGGFNSIILGRPGTTANTVATADPGSNNFYSFAPTSTTFQVADTAAIPEPSSLALMAMGAAGVAAWRSRRKKQPVPTEE